MLETLIAVVPPACWLVVYLACLAGPRLGRAPRRSRPAGETSSGPAPEPGEIPPAVIALLAGRDSLGLFAATLTGLAHQGWFRIEPPDRPGPVMCVLADRAPSGPLTPYERQAVDHLRQRAGPGGQVPADALTDGFEGGEDKFLKAFRAEVIADARARGLTRPTLSSRAKAVLIMLALIPPGLLLLVTHARASTVGWGWLYFGFLCAMTAGVSSERLTRAGQRALAQWRVYAATSGDAVSAVAVGVTRGPFGGHGKNTAWSGFGDTWRQVTVPDAVERMWPGITAGAFAVLIVLIVPGIPLLGLLGWLSIPGGHGAELGISLAFVLIIIRFATAVGRWRHLPWFAEFDGLILRQWQVEGDDTITHYVAIDDGISASAWTLEVPGGVASALTPGTLVHARVNPRLNKQLALEPLRRLGPAPLCDPLR